MVNGEPFGLGSATGITMSRLFRGWPADRLACLHLSRISPDESACMNYWTMGPRDLRSVRWLFGGSAAQRPQPSFIRLAPAEASPLSGMAASIATTLRRLRVRVAGQSVRELDVYRVPDQVLRAIDAFRPDLIYSMLGSNTLLQLVLDLSSRFSVPIVPHFMDDWPTTLYRSSLLRAPLRKKMLARLDAVLGSSPRRLVIGDAMAEEYRHRYGGEFEPFLNAVEPDVLQRPVAIGPPRDYVKLVYVGGLHLNRWRSLRDIAVALEGLREEGFRAEAIVYSQLRFFREGGKLDIAPVMHFAGELAPSDVYTVLQDADILLHVESFDRSSQSFARYSVSTKIPESMAAGRAILAYGPETAASVRYVRDSGAGLAVSTRDSHALAAAIRELGGSENLRASLGARGHLVALDKHDALVQRQRFRMILQSVLAMSTGDAGCI